MDDDYWREHVETQERLREEREQQLYEMAGYDAECEARDMAQNPDEYDQRVIPLKPKAEPIKPKPIRLYRDVNTGLVWNDHRLKDEGWYSLDDTPEGYIIYSREDLPLDQDNLVLEVILDK